MFYMKPPFILRYKERQSPSCIVGYKLACQASFLGSNPSGVEFFSTLTLKFPLHSLSLAPVHQVDMAEVLLKEMLIPRPSRED